MRCEVHVRHVAIGSCMSSEALDAREEALADPERRYQTSKFLLKLAVTCGRVDRNPLREDEMLLQAELYKLLYEAAPWLEGFYRTLEKGREETK